MEATAVVFVNIGHWRRRKDFYRHLPNAKPGVPPPKEKFEARERRRYWLSLAPSLGE